MSTPIVILGAGLSGLSASYHLGHKNCLILEKKSHAFGHIHSVQSDGFTWDEGPHLSFSKHEYVRKLFARGVDDEYEEFEIKASNYYKGHWISHPAQTSLYQVPEPMRTQCVDSFLKCRSNLNAISSSVGNYQEWLEQAFGKVFAREFPAAYTRKYWTRQPHELTVDWIGNRVFYPSIKDVVDGSRGPLGRSTHYITRVRYPKKGGYQSFARKLCEGARIRTNAKIQNIDLGERKISLENGGHIHFERLICTIPLPVFITLCRGVPEVVKEAANVLNCTQLLVVNITAPHQTRRPETWMYIYDENLLATRINFTEKLAAANAPPGWTGIQTEVYYSRHKPLLASPSSILDRVREELVQLELLDVAFGSPSSSPAHIVRVPWANVIFDHETKPALDIVWRWLEQFGLQREPEDLNPLTDWDHVQDIPNGPAQLAFAGRYAQWKYYWTDDCVLRGQLLGRAL